MQVSGTTISGRDGRVAFVRQRSRVRGGFTYKFVPS